MFGIYNAHFFFVQYRKRTGTQIIQIGLHQCLPDVRLAAAGKNDAVHFVVQGHEAGAVTGIHSILLILQGLIELSQVHIRQVLTGQADDGPFESQAHEAVFFDQCRVYF